MPTSAVSSPDLDAVIDGAGTAALEGWSSFDIGGADRLDLLQRLSSADLAPLSAGRSVTTLFLSPNGRLMHRVLLLPRGEMFRALAEPGSDGTFREWIDHYTFADDVTVERSAETRALVMLGRRAVEVAAAVAGAELAREGDQAVSDDGVAWAVRSFGPLSSVLVFGPSEALDATSRRLHGRGAPPLAPAELEQLRIEAGVGITGHELTEDYFPAEAGLLNEVCFTKGCYTGQEIVARQDTYGKVTRRLVGLCFEDRIEPGLELAGGGKACRVTSAAPHEATGMSGHASLGYVRLKESEDGTTIETKDGVSGRVVALPFPRFR